MCPPSLGTSWLASHVTGFLSSCIASYVVLSMVRNCFDFLAIHCIFLHRAARHSYGQTCEACQLILQGMCRSPAMRLSEWLRGIICTIATSMPTWMMQAATWPWTQLTALRARSSCGDVRPLAYCLQTGQKCRMHLMHVRMLLMALLSRLY